MNLLNCLGVGIVASVKETNTNDIFVYLPSSNPLADGEIVATIDTEVNKAYDSSGKLIASKVLKTNAEPATWLSFNSNRITSPDVRPGSKVAIYRFADQDKYLWTTIGVGDTFRLETVIYAWNASPKTNENVELGSDNCYILEMDTRNKKVSFKTSQANGELCGMEFTFNPGDGIFGYIDTEDNMIMVNTQEHQTIISNAEKSTIQINKRTASITTTDSITLSALNDINIRTTNFNVISNKTNIQAFTSVNINSPLTDIVSANVSVTSAVVDINSGSVNVKSTSVGVTSASTLLVCPINNIVGNLFIAGGVYCTKTPDGLGGDMEMDGNITIKNGDITVQGVSFLNHRHTEYHGTTGTPIR